MKSESSVLSPMLHRAARAAEADEKQRVPAPYDTVLLGLSLLLMGFGIVMIYSSSAAIADKRFGSSTYYLMKHLLNSGMAIASLIFGMNVCYKRYQKYVYWLFGGSIVLMMLLLVPGIGVTIGKSTRWMNILGFSFQPSELVKITFVIYMAYSLAKKTDDKIRTFSIGFLPHVIMAGIVVFFCLAQPDFGTSVILAAILFVLLFVAGTRISYLVLAIFVSIPVVIRLITASTMRKNRVLAFLDPWAFRWTEGFQIINSITAIGSGHWTGLGLGNGRQKLGHIPTPQTDFIFPIIGEELGFVGVTIVLGAFVLLISRGFRIALRCRDEFGRYLAFGLTMLLGFGAFIHMGVALNLLPTKGLTLPFVSFGGSSLMLSTFTVGILLNISKYNENPMDSLTMQTIGGENAPQKPRKRRPLKQEQEIARKQ